MLGAAVDRAASEITAGQSCLLADPARRLPTRIGECHLADALNALAFPKLGLLVRLHQLIPAWDPLNTDLWWDGMGSGMGWDGQWGGMGRAVGWDGTGSGMGWDWQWDGMGLAVGSYVQWTGLESGMG